MNNRQRRTLESFQCALAFTTTLPDVLANASLVPLRTELARIIERLAAQAADQETGTRQRRAGTRRLDTLLETLRRAHLQPITALARQHLNLATPGIEESLRMPRRSDPTSMLQAAASIASCVEPHAALFVAQGGFMPDFVQRLRDAAQAVATVVAERAVEKSRMVHATAALRADLRRGAAVVRLLDLLVSVELRGDAARLHTWKTAKRPLALQGAAGGSVGSAPAAAPAVQAA